MNKSHWVVKISNYARVHVSLKRIMRVHQLCCIASMHPARELFCHAVDRFFACVTKTPQGDENHFDGALGIKSKGYWITRIKFDLYSYINDEYAIICHLSFHKVWNFFHTLFSLFIFISFLSIFFQLSWIKFVSPNE